MLIGVVGKANVGKSTFFKAATLAEVDIANYPFATIRPNRGVGYVRLKCADEFFNTQCDPHTGFCINHQRFVPVEMLDVAGLVPGAHKGLGMGNQFLDDLRQADVLIHIVDISGSTNEKGEPVPAGTYYPAEDIKFLPFELDMWYFQIIKKGWEKFARQVHQEHANIAKAIAKQLSGLKVDEDMAKNVLKKLNFNSSITEWNDSDIMLLAKEFRKLTKPMIIAANKIDIHGAKDNFQKLKRQFPEFMFIPCSAESELALREAAKKGLIDYIPGDSSFKITGKLNKSQEKALAFIKENILEKFGNTGVQQAINSAVFDILKYIAVFPGGVNKLADKEGKILPDCFLLPEGSTALDFAYKVHSDLGNKFIKAIDVKTKMIVGKEHKLKHLDVIEIVSGK